jgi:hypothetical protein
MMKTSSVVHAPTLLFGCCLNMESGYWIAPSQPSQEPCGVYLMRSLLFWLVENLLEQSWR